MTDSVTKLTPLTRVDSNIPYTTLRQGEVALVGAGPGDPELLTIKALNMLRQAQVILYDYLVSPQILSLAPSGATLVCVGKRAGAHSVPQDKTNRLLVDYALQGYRVVRIKGGDPFVFGRGAEELEVLVEAGITFQVVPGITAASGATAYAGIPLTHRDYAQSAVFVTGHLKDGTANLDWATLARANQTLVIYMGLMKSQFIQQQLMHHGRAESTPVAIIENGTLAQQKIFSGVLSELPQLAAQGKAPALIVVGEVVALQQRLAWNNTQPPPAPIIRQSGLMAYSS